MSMDLEMCDSWHCCSDALLYSISQWTNKLFWHPHPLWALFFCRALSLLRQWSNALTMHLSKNISPLHRLYKTAHSCIAFLMSGTCCPEPHKSRTEQNTAQNLSAGLDTGAQKGHLGKVGKMYYLWFLVSRHSTDTKTPLFFATFKRTTCDNL